jgi:hypothetical protein
MGVHAAGLHDAVHPPVDRCAEHVVACGHVVVVQLAVVQILAGVRDGCDVDYGVEGPVKRASTSRSEVRSAWT